jgi:AraC-like DNA-binding protein
MIKSFRLFYSRLTKQLAAQDVLFRKSLVLVLTITCLPTAILGALFYFFGSQYISKEIILSHETRFKKALERIDENFSTLEQLVTQWAYNPAFSYGLRENDLYSNVQTHDLFKSLLMMKLSNPLIEEVFLYLDKQQVVISENDGIVSITNAEELQFYQSQLRNGKPIRYSTAPFSLLNNKYGTRCMLIRNLDQYGNIGNGMFLVTLNPQKLQTLVNELNDDADGMAGILNGSDFVAVTPPRPAFDFTSLPGAYEPNDRAGTYDIASYQQKFNGEQYSTSIGNMARLGSSWKFVSVTRLDRLLSPLYLISKIIIIINCAGLLVAIVLAWFASRRIYRPIQRLLSVFKQGDRVKELAAGKDEIAFIESQWKHLSRESKIMQEKVEQHLPRLKEGFLHQFIQGHFNYLNEAELRTRMELLGWNVSDQTFYVLLVQLSGFSKLEGRFSDGDQQLVTFAAVNIIKEITEGYLHSFETVNFQDLTVGVLFSVSRESNSDFKRQLVQLAEEYTEALDTVLKMNVTVGISGKAEQIKQIPPYFEQTKQLLRFRSIHIPHQIMDLDNFISNEAVQGDYPFGLEQDIIRAIRLGNEAEAVELVQQFVQQLGSHSANEYQLRQGVLQLIGSIQHANLQTGFASAYLDDGIRLYEQLLKLNEPEEIVAVCVTKVIQPLTASFHEKHDMRMKGIIEQVVAAISAQYMNDISLEMCADTHRIHPYTLSKYFKEITGMNFIDFITDVRIKKAKELLTETNLKITEISERVGYQPTYFNRIFKKNELMTPSQYRDLHKSPKADL